MPKTATKTSTKTRTVPYDVAEQLRTPEEMAAYLDAWLAEAPDDAAGIARAGRHRPGKGNDPGCPRCGPQPGESVQGPERERQPELCHDPESGACSRSSPARGSGLTARPGGSTRRSIAGAAAQSSVPLYRRRPHRRKATSRRKLAVATAGRL